jgi:cytochrome b6-f complex iron-sulfur subunit
MSISPTRTPQEYEILTGGGAEAAEIQRKGLTRRQVLRRGVGITLGIAGLEGTFAALTMLYPNLAGGFGAAVTVGAKEKYVASGQREVALDQKGIFYEAKAKSYIMHLTDPQFLMNGDQLQNFLDSETWTKDDDGTYWLALYQVCVHLGCKVPYRDDCNSFKCPCHGSHYNVDGEYLDGPAPRSLDRFAMSFSGGNVVVDTGKINQHIERPDVTTRMLPVPSAPCAAQ